MGEAGAAPAAVSGQGGAPAGSGYSNGAGVPAPMGAGLPAPTGGAVPSEWTSGFNDELKDYVQTKGFKDSAALADSYRNFEKLMGVPQEQIIKLPSKDDDPSWDQISQKLGWPKEAKDYNIEVPKDFGDPEFADWAKKMFHENRVPRRMAETISKKWNEYVATNRDASTKQYNQQIDQQTSELKKEWGAAFDQNVEVGKRAVRTFGIDATAISGLEQALGFAKTMKLMHTIGTKIGEDNFVSGSQNNSSFGGVLTPEQARGRITSLRGDPEFTRRYISGEVGPRQEMETLHRMAYPDQA